MTNGHEYKIRTMAFPEIDFVIEWAVRERWNQAFGNKETFFRTLNLHYS